MLWNQINEKLILKKNNFQYHQMAGLFKIQNIFKPGSLYI